MTDPDVHEVLVRATRERGDAEPTAAAIAERADRDEPVAFYRCDWTGAVVGPLVERFADRPHERDRPTTRSDGDPAPSRTVSRRRAAGSDDG